jgi:hypothetical protein
MDNDVGGPSNREVPPLKVRALVEGDGGLDKEEAGDLGLECMLGAKTVLQVNWSDEGIRAPVLHFRIGGSGSYTSCFRPVGVVDESKLPRYFSLAQVVEEVAKAGIHSCWSWAIPPLALLLCFLRYGRSTTK